ncbi:MAG: hypothetical protein PVG03_05195 [Desulfarculaceae bacterium]
MPLVKIDAVEEIFVSTSQKLIVTVRKVIEESLDTPADRFTV